MILTLKVSITEEQKEIILKGYKIVGVAIPPQDWHKVDKSELKELTINLAIACKKALEESTEFPFDENFPTESDLQ